MAESEKPDEDKQEAKTADTNIAQPATTAKQEPAPTANTGGSNGDPKPPQPMLVQLVGGEDLKPFEERTIALTEESVTISRGTYRVAVFGFLAALAAAVFVGVQVHEMTKQTQILASQSEAAAAGAAMGELNTRKQLAIAQQQAQAAQDSVDAIKRQMRQDQRAWLKITVPDAIHLRFMEPITANMRIVNIGKTVARVIHVRAIIEKVSNGQSPLLRYHIIRIYANFRGGMMYPNEPQDFPVALYKETIIPPPWQPMPDAKRLGTADIGALQAGDEYFVVYARGTYTDIFGVDHWVTVCDATFKTPSKGITAKACADYSDADNN